MTGDVPSRRRGNQCELKVGIFIVTILSFLLKVSTLITEKIEDILKNYIIFKVLMCLLVGLTY